MANYNYQGTTVQLSISNKARHLVPAEQYMLIKVTKIKIKNSWKSIFNALNTGHPTPAGVTDIHLTINNIAGQIGARHWTHPHVTFTKANVPHYYFDKTAGPYNARGIALAPAANYLYWFNLLKSYALKNQRTNII